MNYNAQFVKYDQLVHNDIYCSKIGASNILFMGGCRSYIYAIFFEELCKRVPWFQHAQHGFGAVGVHIMELVKRTKNKTPNLIRAIENADYIVCEQSRNYNILNSSPNCDQNIFNNFKIKDTCKIIQIPNLELKYYVTELNVSNENFERIKEIKRDNLNRFINHLNKYNFNKLATYVENNINVKRLFVTYNHPCNHLLLELFKELIEKLFNKELSVDVICALEHVQIFDNDGTKCKIVRMDGVSFE
jgi:hypothetical protein